MGGIGPIPDDMPREEFEPLFDVVAAAGGVLVEAAEYRLVPRAGAGSTERYGRLYVPAWRAA